MKNKILISILSIILLISISSNIFAASKINLKNENSHDKYNFKHNSAYMEVEKTVIDKKEYDIVYLSTEFFENFSTNSYYDKENQIFYFDKPNNIYVKADDNTYYEGETKFPLVVNCNIGTKVIDDMLYIPLCINRNSTYSSLELGYDNKTNTLKCFGPTRITYEDDVLPKISGVVLKENIPSNGINDLDYNDTLYITLNKLQSNANGCAQYYIATMSNKSCIIRTFMKYSGEKNKYVYANKYDIVSEITSGDIVGKVADSYLKIENHNKYGLTDLNGNTILDTIYDDIELIQNTHTSKARINDVISSISYINGDILKLKKDNKYTLYSLTTKNNILNDTFIDDIDFSFKFNVNRPSSLNEINSNEATREVESICLQNNDKFGILLSENIMTDIDYTKIEGIELTYSNTLGDAICIEDKIIWKLYKDNEVYVLCELNNANAEFTNIGDKYYISNNSFDDVNIEQNSSGYLIHGINGHKKTTLFDIARKNAPASNKESIINIPTLVVFGITAVCIVIMITSFITARKENKEIAMQELANQEISK